MAAYREEETSRILIVSDDVEKAGVIAHILGSSDCGASCQIAGPNEALAHVRTTDRVADEEPAQTEPSAHLCFPGLPDYQFVNFSSRVQLGVSGRTGKRGELLAPRSVRLFAAKTSPRAITTEQ